MSGLSGGGVTGQTVTLPPLQQGMDLDRSWTDTCENITFPRTVYVGSNYEVALGKSKIIGNTAVPYYGLVKPFL